MKHHYKKNQQTVLEAVVLGLGRVLWWLITLPFKKGQGRYRISQQDRSYITSKRHEIEALQRSDSIIELKHAVMEADKLVDFVLKKRGYKGESFAERLHFAEKHIDQSIYQNIWDGHKTRNLIAHSDENIEKSTLISATNKLLSYIRK